MAYTGTAAQQTTLKNAVETHPNYDSGENLELDWLPRLNSYEDGVNVEPGGPHTGVPPLTAGLLLDTMWGKATATQLEFMLGLLFSTLDNGLDTDISMQRASIVDESAVQLSNAINALTRPLNQAEVLFADPVDPLVDYGNTEFVLITATQISEALENG